MADLVLTGRVTKDARAHISRAGHWQISLEFTPHTGPRGKPRRYLVVKDYGSGEASGYVCRNQAKRLANGVRVRVHAAGEDDARGRSVLAGVDRIDTPDLPPPTSYLERQDR